MKRALFFSLATSLLAACSGGDPGTNGEEGLPASLVENPATADGSGAGEAPAFTFDGEAYDFGTITQGEKVSYSFRFRNSGKRDLIISSASGSCGCTVPDWPRKPIPPGKEGVIDVVFDSEGKSGRQDKSVTVLANTVPANTTLRITGEVLAPDNQIKTEQP